ncbi:MAG: inositol-3-phosphate synthase [Planctomycetes bacterium]|nr:inositol-3-phosphate synthase [Planctomycetota bacterium]
MTDNKTGVWLIGAYGSVATTALIGARSLAKGLIKPTGLITELPEITRLLRRPAGTPRNDILEFDNLVFGGHEIRKSSFKDSIKQLQQTGIHIPSELLVKIKPDLKQIEPDIRQGLSFTAESPRAQRLPLAEMVNRLVDDITGFKKKHSLERVIVVNLASTEPPMAEGAHTKTLKGFETALSHTFASLSASRLGLFQPSVLYAYAAFKAGCPYINFTPSAGASIPALLQMARKLKLPHCGTDGKTGETLVKSALAPMFNYRNLNVLSWQGYNILGNLDGKALADPAACKSKIDSKSNVLSNILGYQPHSFVGIDYVPSLGDWKTAWDFIHFEGFLGTKMAMQFVWQGCDSILAAPLALDLIRLVDLAHRQGESGELAHLALFFKKPLGTKENNLHKQWELLKSKLI